MVKYSYPIYGRLEADGDVISGVAVGEIRSYILAKFGDSQWNRPWVIKSRSLCDTRTEGDETRTDITHCNRQRGHLAFLLKMHFHASQHITTLDRFFCHRFKVHLKRIHQHSKRLITRASKRRNTKFGRMNSKQVIPTILYWVVSMMAFDEYRSNIDRKSPCFLAVESVTIGCSCMWSPTRTIWLGLIDTIGIRLSGSVHIPHSSIISWEKKRKKRTENAKLFTDNDALEQIKKTMTE